MNATPNGSAALDVAVVSAGGSGGHGHDAAWLELQDIRHYEIAFPQVMWSKDMLRIPQTARRILRMAAKYKPDIVHVHWRSTAWCAEFLRWRLGLPFVVTVHVEGIPNNWSRKLLSFWGDGIIAVSSDTREDVSARFKIAPQRVQVIPYGVDERYYRTPTAVERQEARRALAVVGSETVVCLVGSGWRRKGHDLLIRAVALLRDGGTPIRALLAGSEADRPVVERLVAEHRLGDRVTFLGYMDSRPVLWASDILALPSRAEGLPIAVIEAMLCAVVPIRTPAGGAADQVSDGLTGFLVPFEDASALAERLRLLCEDVPRRLRMQEAALSYARLRFTRTRMAQEVLAVYERAIHQCQTRPAVTRSR